MLKHIGVPIESIEVEDVEIQIRGEKNNIRTLILGDRSKKMLVILHGYGGSHLMFWKILKPLAQ